MIIDYTPIDVIDFITLIRESCPSRQIHIFRNGACYQFFKILKSVYPQAVAYYNQDHVITEIDGKYYDITGEVEKEGHEILEEEPIWGKVCQVN